jgi:hypothetical protein
MHHGDGLLRVLENVVLLLVAAKVTASAAHLLPGRLPTAVVVLAALVRVLLVRGVLPVLVVAPAIHIVAATRLPLRLLEIVVAAAAPLVALGLGLQGLGRVVFGVLREADGDALGGLAELEAAHRVHRVLRRLVVYVVNEGDALSIFIACQPHLNTACKAFKQLIKVLLRYILRYIANIQGNITFLRCL